MEQNTMLPKINGIGLCELAVISLFLFKMTVGGISFLTVIAPVLIPMTLLLVWKLAKLIYQDFFSSSDE